MLQINIPQLKLLKKKHYVQVVTLSTQDNAKLLPQLKTGIKEQLIGINIYQKQNY